MSYSLAEAKVTEVTQAVAKEYERLRALKVEAERIGERLDRAVRNAGPIVTEIDTEAGTGSDLWGRLKERKDQVRTDLQSVRASASAILAAIEAELS